MKATVDTEGVISLDVSDKKSEKEAVFVTDVVKSADPACIESHCSTDLKQCAADGHCDKILECGRHAMENVTISARPDMSTCLQGLRLSQLDPAEVKVFQCAKKFKCVELESGASLADVVGHVRHVKRHSPGSSLMRRDKKKEDSELSARDVSIGQCPSECHRIEHRRRRGPCKHYRLQSQCHTTSEGILACDSGSLCFLDDRSADCNNCGTVLCSYFGELGWLPDAVIHGDIAFLALLSGPGRICHQGYLTWATHTVAYMKSLPEGHNDRSMLFFFVEHWAKTMAAIAGSPHGEMSVMGVILLMVGMPPCFFLGLMPSLTFSFGHFIHMFVTHILARLCYNAPWLFLAPVCWQVSRTCSNSERQRAAQKAAST